MVEVNMTIARQRFSDLANQVIYGGERVQIKRSGKTVLALIAIEDLEVLEAIEDYIDLEAAKAAIARNDFVPWDEVKKELRTIDNEVHDRD